MTPAGLEPAASGLGIPRSIHLSYGADDHVFSLDIIDSLGAQSYVFEFHHCSCEGRAAQWLITRKMSIALVARV